jgi:hypothetical protein
MWKHQGNLVKALIYRKELIQYLLNLLLYLMNILESKTKKSVAP